MTEPVPIRRALLSVSDKAGVVELGAALVRRGVELCSTGGTARALADAGLDVTPVESLTGFPEMLHGRVKTLHPGVHAGILHRRDDETHRAAMQEHGLQPIDLVCINLYPFERTVANPETSRDEAIEQIDVGGPAMIRAAAKNHRWVTVLTDPVQYADLLAELDQHDGATSHEFRAALARAAFARTSAYDAAIAAYLAHDEAQAGAQPDSGELPERLDLRWPKGATLRYGENPHQRAALYLDPAHHGPSVAGARQIHGKPLSYNNINDASAALELVMSLTALERPVTPARLAAAVVKHANPCGAACAPALAQAASEALAGDPVAAYGGIMALGAPVDLETAELLCGDKLFLEVVVAPAFEADAAERLRTRWKNLRMLEVGPLPDHAAHSLHLRTVPGGMLAQESDATVPAPEAWTHQAGPAPTPTLLRHAAAMEAVVRALSSNAVCIGGAGTESDSTRLFGAGAGQMDRVASCRLAVDKAGKHAAGSVVASDAFFPFPDGPEILAEAGVAMIVHPGGSKRDQETFDLCDARGITCMTTGLRHFRH